jgi:Predicted membrane protein (DUF2306)
MEEPTPIAINVKSSVPRSERRTRLIGSSLNVLLCSSIAIVSFRYLLGVGPVSPIVFANVFKNPWLVVHVGGAATALLVSPLQLMSSIRRRLPAFHRWTGRLYVVCCAIGGFAGVILALGSAAGRVATAGFGLLAVAWMTTTLTGWRAGRRKQFARHRAWMIRSFALTFAAVTLRIYLAVLPALPIGFMQGYRAISFLCWVPNFIVAELVLRRLYVKARIAGLLNTHPAA